MRRIAKVTRGVVVLASAALLLAPAVVSAQGEPGEVDADAEAAAIAIADARERANDAADAMFAAESRLDELELEQTSLQSEIDSLEEEIAELQTMIENVAVNRFTRSGTNSQPLLTGFRSAGEQSQMDVLLDVVNDTSAEDFDEFDALNNDLDVAMRALADAQEDTEQARADFESAQAQALAEVKALKEIEADRLEDEAVQIALEAIEAERQVLIQTAEKLEATEEAIDAGVTDREEIRPELDGDADGSTNEATGGTGGGQTGNSGIGGRPGSMEGIDLGFDGWACPVQGPVAFGDTWGAPRSGGRLHQGVDIIGERGLPVVAVVDGFAQQRVNELGGNTVWLTGTDGNKYYYAHLDSWESLGTVTVGTIIGYLGQTGNARFSVPHLHFEIHPGGAAAVNPYPTTRAHC